MRIASIAAKATTIPSVAAVAVQALHLLGIISTFQERGALLMHHSLAVVESLTPGNESESAKALRL